MRWIRPKNTPLVSRPICAKLTLVVAEETNPPLMSVIDAHIHPEPGPLHNNQTCLESGKSLLLTRLVGVFAFLIEPWTTTGLSLLVLVVPQ